MERIDFENDERLSIITVANKCEIEIVKPIDHDRVLAVCPFCDDKTGHLYLTLKNSKGYYNVYKCVKCGKSGGAVALYGELKGLDKKEAFRELINDKNSSNIKRARQVIKRTKEIEENVPTREIEYLDKVYNRLLSLLKLNKNDYNNLIKRGLNREKIINNNYKSMPSTYCESKKIAQMIMKEFDLRGVPGFFLNNKNEWTMISKDGFLIPVRDLDGRIVSLQIRLSKKEGKLRYKYLSSAKCKEGSKAIASVHLVGEANDKIYITEGPLKADIANYYSEDTFIALPGVNVVQDLAIEYLVKLKCKVAVIAFDMDTYNVIEVKRALISLVRKLKENNICVVQKTWFDIYHNDKEIKGIDDFYKFKSEV